MSRRGLGFLAVLTAALVLAQFGLGVSRDRRRWEQQAVSADRVAITALSDSATRLGIRVRTSQARRRVDSALSSPVHSTRSAVLVLDGGAAAAARLADSQFAMLAFPEHPLVPVRLALVEADTAGPRPAGMLRSFALLPEASDQDGCTTVLVVLRGGIIGESFGGGGSRLPLGGVGGAAGPCWFLATFGAPGADIRRWLNSRYWEVAVAIPPSESSFRYSAEKSGSTDLLAHLLLPLLSPFLSQSALEARCAGSKPKLCEKALLAPLPPDLLPDGVAGSEGRRGLAGNPPLWTPVMRVTARRSLLARMVDDLGPDRFARFWGSGAEVPEAFRSAAGESLGDWYRRQLRREFQEAGIPAPLERPFWPTSLAFLGLAIAASLWQAGRRQVR